MCLGNKIKGSSRAVQKTNEWAINDALHAFFMHDKGYMLISQDQDLSIYMDRILVPIAELKLGRKIVGNNKLLAKTRRGTKVSVNPYKFRPDAILLNRDGRVNILETKISNINAVSECDELVIQTLVYANLVISPRWESGANHKNEIMNITYDLVEDLHEAHWTLKVYWEGIYRSVEERHRKYFGLENQLKQQDFNKIPAVIFLVGKINQDRLVAACDRIKQLKFPEYKEYAMLSLQKRPKFQKRLQTLGDNWDKLQKISFSIMRLNVAKFIEVIDSELISVLTNQEEL
jgi:hypothetical protein